MYLITGASNNHFKSLRNLIISFTTHKNDNDKMVVYDLGISNENWDCLQREFPFCIFRIFDYSKYPSYYNININAGEYAWKSALINEYLLELPKDEVLVWMDSGNLITNNLKNIEDTIKNNSLYTPTSSNEIKRWTHPSTIEYMKPVDKLLDYTSRNGACIGFDTSQPWIIIFLKEWAKLCSIKECIAPEGSNRSNHRQDQSILSILYYLYHDNSSSFTICDDYIGFTIHNDVD